MKLIMLTVLFCLCVVTAFADYAGQTNWSGGGGYPGPVLNWANRFDQSAYVDWEGTPGALILDYYAIQHNVATIFFGANSVYSEDIDGDGDQDILGAGQTASDISWWENLNGIGTVWTKHTVDGNFTYASCVFAVDIDGDNDSDVLGAAEYANTIACWENMDGTGTSWTEHIVEDGFENANSVYSEDIDGDGDMDVLGTAFYDGIAWWENSDTSPGVLWTMHTFAGAMSCYSEDIDGDGDMDVLGAAASADDITWWENSDGSGTAWIEHVIDGDFNVAYSVHADDLDGDGDMDALGAAGEGVCWWENTDGTGTSWIEHVVSDDIGFPYSVFSEDMDGDGDVDVLAASFSGGVIVWCENMDGSGTSWRMHIVGVDFSGACSVHADDINGDGKMDVLGAARTDNEITWWDLVGYLAAGSLESSILDTQIDPDWDFIEWDSQVPSGTSVSFQVRASDDYTSMGAWSDTLSIPSLLQGILTDGDQYFQYRVILESTNPQFTSVLLSIMVTWDPMGIEEAEYPDALVLLPFSPNPASIPVVEFGLPEPSLVELSIFDLTGRIVGNVYESEYPAGYHNLLLDYLTPGIYFCRMISGDISATQRFVVIE